MRTTVKHLRSLIHESIDIERVPSPDEVRTTWEDLYVSSLRNKRKTDPKGVTPGKVSFDELVSWLGASEHAIGLALDKAGLVVDRDGNVVDRFN